jgi:hypothetical protein
MFLKLSDWLMSGGCHTIHTCLSLPFYTCKKKTKKHCYLFASQISGSCEEFFLQVWRGVLDYSGRILADAFSSWRKQEHSKLLKDGLTLCEFTISRALTATLYPTHSLAV